MFTVPDTVHKNNCAMLNGEIPKISVKPAEKNDVQSSPFNKFKTPQSELYPSNTSKYKVELYF